MEALNRGLRVHQSVISAEIEDETVLLNIETGMYFGIDAVGTRIWQLLQEDATSDEIVNRMLEEYEVEATELRKDVSDFLDLLLRHGLANE